LCFFSFSFSCLFITFIVIIIIIIIVVIIVIIIIVMMIIIILRCIFSAVFLFYHRVRLTHYVGDGRNTRLDEHDDRNGGRDRNRDRDRDGDGDQESDRNTNRDRDRDGDGDGMSVLDPDSLPALLYQLTSVIRKCGGASQKLRAMVLRATAEVSVCVWVGVCVLVCTCGYLFVYMFMHVIDMCLGLNCYCLSVCCRL
jgi:hypothetical protein